MYPLRCLPAVPADQEEGALPTRPQTCNFVGCCSTRLLMTGVLNEISCTPSTSERALGAREGVEVVERELSY